MRIKINRIQHVCIDSSVERIGLILKKYPYDISTVDNKNEQIIITHIITNNRNYIILLNNFNLLNILYSLYM